MHRENVLDSPAPSGSPRRVFLRNCLLAGTGIPLVGAAAISAAPPAVTEPITIKKTPQFFVDDFIVDNRWSLRPKHEEVLRAFHPPKKHPLNPVLRGDGGYVNVVRDSHTSAFKMWYQTNRSSVGRDEGNEYAIAYAESPDGLNWNRPQLGLHPWDGTVENNIVWRGKGAKRASGAQIVTVAEKDRRGYRFVMTYRTGGVREASGIRVVGSQDGVHWDEANDTLITALPSDTQNSLVFDQIVEEYVLFCRPKDRYLVGGRQDAIVDGESRRIARMSSPELWQRWSGSPQTILIPDELDMHRGFNRFYGMPVKYHAGIYWGFVWPFKLNTDIVTELAWSRDGWTWHRLPTRPRVLELGAENAWDDGMVFGSPDWVESGDEWRLYYAGSDGPHESRDRTMGIGVATLRKEGFVSLRGPGGGGVVCTRQILWPGGKLLVNADASGGELNVRVTSARREPLPGFDYADRQPFTGNSTAQEIRWREKSLELCAGQIVRLEFYLKNADLFTFRAG